MTDHDDLDPELAHTAERLGHLSDPGVPAPVMSAHLTEMAGAARTPGRWASKLRVGAAFFAGLLLGGSGLAAAGALPGGMQNAAHDAFAKVGVDVPDKERSTDGCDGVDYKNHGQFVSSQNKGTGDDSDDGALDTVTDTDDEDADAGSEAAKSDCGKPIQSTEAGKAARAEEREQRKAEQQQKVADKQAERGSDDGPDDDESEEQELDDESVDDESGDDESGDDESGDDGDRPDDVPPVETPGGPPAG